MVRSWVSLAESTALIWLDGRRIPRAELEVQLVHDFAALAAVSAAYDQGWRASCCRCVAGAGGRAVRELLARLSAFAPDVPAVPAQRLPKP
ncbi:TetR/AcrR family transcriptional regulator [Streptomyces californicus]